MLFTFRKILAEKVYYGWIIVLACFLATIAVFGSSYSFSVFFDAFLASFDASRSQIALVFGVQSALLYVIGVGVARLIEYRGPQEVLALSSAILVFGLVCTAFARSYLELLLALGMIAPVGMAGVYIVGWATLPLWFKRRRGTAVSLAAAGTGVSLVAAPVLVESVVRILGWRTAMLVLAGVMAVLLGSAVLIIVDTPSQVGADLSTEFGDSGTVSENPLEKDEIRDIVFSMPFLLAFFGWLFIYIPFYAILSHVVLYTADIGVGRSTGVLSLTLIGVMTMIARIGIGPLADRVGRVATFIVCSILLGVAAIGVAGITTGVSMMVVALAAGTGYGGAGGLLGAVTADLFGERSINILFAVLSLSFGVSGFVAPPLAGLWFEYMGSYRGVFLVTGLIGILGAGCVVLVVVLQDGS